MNRTIFRITNAFKFFFVALAKPELLKADTFKMMADLLAMIMKVSAERRPMMAHVAFLNIETENAPMISIWAARNPAAVARQKTQKTWLSNAKSA